MLHTEVFPLAHAGTALFCPPYCQHLNCKFTVHPNFHLLPIDPIQHFPLTKYLFQINWPEDQVVCICLDYFLPKLTSIDIIFLKGTFWQSIRKENTLTVQL